MRNSLAWLNSDGIISVDIKLANTLYNDITESYKTIDFSHSVAFYNKEVLEKTNLIQGHFYLCIPKHEMLT